MKRMAHALMALLGAAILVIGIGWWQQGGGIRAAASLPQLAGTIPAPEFPAGLDWINTDGEALTLEQLRGKVILLDFWTYGCINCFHIIPDLEKLQAKYGNALVVIGVHSAKFASEGETRRIAAIAHRYERDEPIVNDREYRIWNQYGVRAWPTVTLIDPDGKIVGQQAGEGIYELFDLAIESLVDNFSAQGKIDRSPLPYQSIVMPETFLKFPGKVTASPDGKKIYIADSNHHRIVVTDETGKVQQVFGSGEPGLKDGKAGEAQFRQPQGLALDGRGNLYVADTRNNAIRRIDLAKGVVETLAGTGEQVYMRSDTAMPGRDGLNSPWDVLWRDDTLYIAMAGQHQLWEMDLTEKEMRAWAGTRREALIDGPRLRAALNQPSGLATDGKRLYFADAEASAIRYVDFASGELDTLVGTGLFDFGDRDGIGDAVRLQHPLGVAFAGGKLYIADTYNDKIKVLDPKTRQVKTLLGGDDGDSVLFEPGGIAHANGKLYIADTNHHSIKVYDLATWQLATLNIAE